MKNIICGKIYVTDKFILFKNENNFNFKNIKYIFHSNQKEITFNNKIILMRFSEIDEIITRKLIEIHRKNKKYEERMIRYYESKKTKEKFKNWSGD